MTSVSQRDPHEIKALSRSDVVDEFDNLVLSIVNAIRKKLKLRVELADLENYGYEGLLAAHERFDPRQKTSFASFAYYRIRGAILDGCRKEGWLTRSRDRAELDRQITMNEYLQATAATHEAMPDARTFREAAARVSDMVSDMATVFLLNEVDELLLEELRVAPRQGENIDAEDTRQMIELGFDLLDDREREVLVRFYFEGESMLEIADSLGYSRSWVSRVNTRAIEKMREVLLDPRYSGRH